MAIPQAFLCKPTASVGVNFSPSQITSIDKNIYLAPSIIFLAPGRIEWCYGLRTPTPTSI